MSETVSVHVIDDQGDIAGPVEQPKIVKTDDEWRDLLGSEETFHVARGKGTERPFCGTLLDNKLDGVYVCVCCQLPLYDSDSKFNSGTGWPSFFQPVGDNVTIDEDRSHGMIRTEILCARCDCHLGHVFPDGPPPTGERHCVNSESLKFVERSDLKSVA